VACKALGAFTFKSTWLHSGEYSSETDRHPLKKRGVDRRTENKMERESKMVKECVQIRDTEL
jgi:hypothetical protein